MNSVPFVEPVMRDARYAWRILRRTPVFTATAVLTVALAIAINTAVFSVIDGVLLKPLPYPRPDRLGLVLRVVSAAQGEGRGTAVDGRTWDTIRDHATTIERAVLSDWTTGVNLVVPATAGPGQARYVQQQRVGTGFFQVLGVSPLIGREFTAEEDVVNGPPAAILSAALWRGLFNADASIVGRRLMLRGEPYTIVGVMPDGFSSGQAADLWTPLRPTLDGEGGGENYHILVRLRDGASWPAAMSEVGRLGLDLTRERPPQDGVRIAFSLIPLQEGITAELRQPLLMLWVAVGLVLLVACVNLAGLLLARASQRTREIATRLALGSARSAVIRQLFVESVVLAAVGGALGIALGFLTLDALRWLARDAFELWQPVGLDGRAIVVGTILSLVASVTFGLAPAVQASRLDVRSGLLESGRSIAGRASRWPRRLLVVTQVTLGAVLLVGAGLLLRTFEHLRTLQPGFDSSGVVTASLSLEDARYRTAAPVLNLFDESLTRIRSTPGVEAAAVTLGLPYERLLNLGFRRVDGQNAETRGEMTSAAYVTPEFFVALRIPIKHGRAFDARDAAGAPAVVVVNDAFARAYFNSDDPVGRRIRLSGSERTIVGVVGDVQLRPGWGENGPLAPMPLTYMPVTQVNDAFLRLVHGWFSPTFVVRSTRPAGELAGAIRRAVDAVDPLLPFAKVRVMAEVRAEAIAPQRFLAALLVGLAMAAVLLAGIGLHGLIATSVAERTREMGIRMALGATQFGAVRAVALPGLILAASGTAAGLAVAAVAARLLRHFVWGVAVNDPVTFTGVAIVLLGVATIASIAPTLRLLRLDPATTLRRD
jgi:predicted permease